MCLWREGESERGEFLYIIRCFIQNSIQVNSWPTSYRKNNHDSVVSDLPIFVCIRVCRKCSNLLSNQPNVCEFILAVYIRRMQCMYVTYVSRYLCITMWITLVIHMAVESSKTDQRPNISTLYISWVVLDMTLYLIKRIRRIQQ